MTMDDDNNNNNSSNNSSNWLGFSLSNNMKIGVSNSSVPTSFFLSTHQQINNTALCFPGADVSFSSGFHHPSQQLSVMPIKSDGSLCIMEALSRSQSEDSSPKLENFLGSERETVPLSLNNIYYQEDANRQQQQQQQQYSSSSSSMEAFQQHYPYYSTGEEQKGNSSLITGFSADQISQMPNWVARSYSTQQVMENQHLGSVNLVASADQAMPIGAHDTCLAMESKKRGSGKVGQKQIVHRKSIDTFGQRTSQFRGVTKHRWTGRYEAHLWDNSCKKEGQTRKGRQVYLGGYDMEEKAARAYDLAALKYWGPSTHINFPVENYKEGLEEMKNMTRQEFVAHLRRRSSGFSRGASMYRGVTRHHQHGRWQARIGRVAGNKDLYLGTFSTQEEAAEAYDVAAIKFRGSNAVTNFDITRYDVDKIMSSNTLLAGDQAKKIKPIDHSPSSQINVVDSNHNNSDWKMVLGEQQQQMGFDHQRQEVIQSVGINYQGLASGNQQMEMNKMGSVQLSNASSIVTSLNSSREGSPAEKSGSSPNIMMFGKAPISWIQQPTANFPLYAAWSDAS